MNNYIAGGGWQRCSVAAGPADCFSPGDNELPPSLTAESRVSVKFVDFRSLLCR